MRVKSVVLPSLLIGAALLFGASPAPAAEDKASQTHKAKAVLKDASGKEVGTAIFTTTPSGTLLDLKLTAIPPGVHAVHVHAVGKCEPPDFKSAGPHFNPDQTKHGIMSPEGPHAGDLPNIHVPPDGKLEVEFLDPVVTIAQEAALLDADGSSIVIHAGPDDYKTDPAGNSGDRIACGVITAAP
ncbi:MAG TPA: superoxide dismutase family protein [Methyloceanibacter sp.]|nr:superoxide dismutase family protein [Methyloceanibacter sp.]